MALSSKQPSADLLPRFLVEGAREHSLPRDYIEGLERINAVADTNAQREGEKRAVACGVAL
jgi:hypothetical protein